MCYKMYLDHPLYWKNPAQSLGVAPSASSIERQSPPAKDLFAVFAVPDPPPALRIRLRVYLPVLHLYLELGQSGHAIRVRLTVWHFPLEGKDDEWFCIKIPAKSAVSS